MSSLCSHEQRMNKRINSTNLEQALQSRASIGGMVVNNVVEAMVVVEVEEDTTTSTIKIEIVTQILLKKEATLLNLKISHTYIVLNAKSMDIIS